MKTFKVIFEIDGMHVSETIQAETKEMARTNFVLFGKYKWDRIITIMEEESR